MKKLFSIALLGALFCSCGEEGIGFNARKEFPLEVPFDLPNGTPEFIEQFPGNPRPISRTDKYSLNDVDAFNSDLDIDEIILNDFAYEITGISSSEQFAIDIITIELNNPAGDQIALIEINSPTLTNVPKTSISESGLTALQQVLDNKEDVTTIMTIDFAEFPNEDISFNFIAYFDVTAKLRDL